MNESNVGATPRHADAGLLALRIGAALTHAMLPFVPEGTKILVAHPGVLPLAVLDCGAFLIALGFMAKPVAALLASAWAWSFISAVIAHALWSDWPLRSLLYAIIFAALLLTGPGKFSLDCRLRARKNPNT